MNMGAPWELENRVEELKQLGGPSKTNVDVDHGHCRELGQHRGDISLAWSPWPVEVVVISCIPVISVHFQQTHTFCIFALWTSSPGQTTVRSPRDHFAIDP